MSTLVLDPFQIFEAEGFSPEAQAVIDRMSGLTNDEKSAIAVFVDAEVLNGNWDLIDEFWCFGLTTEANALKGWFAKTATNNGATKGSTGFSFNGTSNYIDSNFNPSIDGVNYIQNDALVGGYVHTNNDQTGEKGLVSAFDVANRRVEILQNQSTGSILYRANSPSAAADFSESFFDDNALYAVSRINSTSFFLFKNGVSVDTGSINSNGAPNLNIYIGARNNNGTLSNWFNGVISSTIFGAGIGFDHAGHNTNLNALLTSLGVI